VVSSIREAVVSFVIPCSTHACFNLRYTFFCCCSAPLSSYQDIYAGIEFAAGTQGAKDMYQFLKDHKVAKNVRFPETSSFGIKPISVEGTSRLARAAIKYCLEQKRKSVTIVHKGNIMKFTEGAFRDTSYNVAVNEFRDLVVTERESWILDNLDRNPSTFCVCAVHPACVCACWWATVEKRVYRCNACMCRLCFAARCYGVSEISVEDNAKAIEPGFDMFTAKQQADLLAEVSGVVKAIGVSHGNGKWKKKVLVKDAIADITLQQVLTRAKEFDVIATMNLNGDYLRWASDHAVVARR
jgi:isocitrate dehydrogenase